MDALNKVSDKLADEKNQAHQDLRRIVGHATFLNNLMRTTMDPIQEESECLRRTSDGLAERKDHPCHNRDSHGA